MSKSLRSHTPLLSVAAAACVWLIGCSTPEEAAVPATAVDETTTTPIDETSTSAVDDATSTDATTTTVTSCGSGGAVTNGREERVFVTSTGDQRPYIIEVPSSYSDSQPAALVVNMHGHGSNGSDQAGYANFTALAARDAAIVVSPDGSLSNPLYGDALGWGANLRIDDTDVDFLHELVDSLSAEYCIDDVVATGMSAGGDMVSALACLSDTPFRAFAPVTYLYYNADECGGAPPRPIIYFHGTDDVVVPMAGSGDPWFDPPVAEAVARWAAHNGCDPESSEQAVSPEVTLISWAGCAEPVLWYLVEGGGHTWPGAVAVPGLGYTTQDIDATELIWEFFFSQ
jgi:polyhydroxybutyrate depolymerase